MEHNRRHLLSAALILLGLLIGCRQRLRLQFLVIESHPNVRSYQLSLSAYDEYQYPRRVENWVPVNMRLRYLATIITNLEGVEAVTFQPYVVTVTKRSDASWETLDPPIREMLTEYINKER